MLNKALWIVGAALLVCTARGGSETPVVESFDSPLAKQEAEDPR